FYFFFFQAEDGIRDFHVTGVQTCALPISGFRVRPFAKAKNRSPRAILYPQGPWLSAAVGGAWTDGTLAPLVDAFLGYDFAVSENLALGPTAGYLLVLQTRDEQPRDDSAHLVVF